MKKEYKSYPLLFLASILSGGGFIFPAILRNYHVSPLTQSFFRSFFASTIMFILFLLFNKKILQVTIKEIVLFFIIGIFVSSGNIFSYSAIKLRLPAAVVAFIFNLQPISTAFLAALFLKESVSKKHILALIISIIDSILLTNLFTLKSFANISFIGVFFALLATLCFSGEIISAKLSNNKKVNPFTIFVFSYFFSSLINLIIGLFFNFYPEITSLRFHFSSTVYLIMFFSAVYGAIYISLTYVAIKHIRVNKVSIVLLIAPISTALLGFIILKEVPTINIILGGFFISFAAFISLHRNITV